MKLIFHFSEYGETWHNGSFQFHNYVGHGVKLIFHFSEYGETWHNGSCQFHNYVGH